MLNNSRLEFCRIICDAAGFTFPGITEFAAGEHPHIYFPPLYSKGGGFGWGVYLTLQSIQKVFLFPGITEFAAGEHPQAYDL